MMVQDAVEVLPVPVFLAYRFLAAAVLVGLVFRREIKALPHEGWRAGGVMGIWLTGGYLFQTLGLERTSAASAGFITGMFVVLTPLFGGIFGRERVPLPAWGAAVVSAVGLFLLSGGGGGLNLLGDGLVFLCACSFSFHILATARAVLRFPTGALLTVQLLVCGVASLLLTLVTGGLEVPSETSVWVALVVTAVAASAIAFFVQTYAQRHAPPARTALILASEPAFAGLFAYLLNDERLSAPAWGGAAMILAAIVFTELLPYLRRARFPEGMPAPPASPEEIGGHAFENGRAPDEGRDGRELAEAEPDRGREGSQRA